MIVPQATTKADALLVELRRAWVDAGAQPFTVGHRALATAIACSPSLLPRLMARLEASGHIARTPHPSRRNTYMIRVIDHPQPVIDHPPAPVIDHRDRSPRSAPRAARQNAVDVDTPRARAHVGREDHDPGMNPPYLPPARATVIDLLRADGAHDTVIADVLRARPDLDPQSYAQERDWCTAAGRGVGYLFGTLRRGSTLRPVERRGPAAGGPLDPAAVVASSAVFRSGSDLSDLDPALLRRLGAPYAA